MQASWSRAFKVPQKIPTGYSIKGFEIPGGSAGGLSREDSNRARLSTKSAQLIWSSTLVAFHADFCLLDWLWWQGRVIASTDKGTGTGAGTIYKPVTITS